MDRSWRNKVDNPLEDEDKTRWQKFKDGRYNVGNLG
jgi:hypothetical protein